MGRKRDNAPLLVAALLVALGIIGWFVYTRIEDRRAQHALQQETRDLKAQGETLSRQIGLLEAELDAVREESTSLEAAAGIFEPSEGDEGAQSLDAHSIEEKILAFFAYLDGRDYLEAYELEKDLFTEYCAVMEKLAARPPRVSGETASLDVLLKNVFHFARTMGVKRAALTAEILKNERDILEPAMRLFYEWFTGEGGPAAGRPSMETQYAYAVFFLESLGGRGYLMRRDSKIRLLSLYYSILMVDRARDAGHNPGGVDIRPFIASVSREILVQPGLAFRGEYQEKLEALNLKYP